MGRSALVVLGAGASHDLMAKKDIKVSAHEEYRSPLVDAIFAPRSSFQPILSKYPGAGVLAETIRLRVPQAPLELVLREYAELPSDHHQAKLYREVPLFLQELFGEVSAHYTGGRQPPNHSHLVNELLAAFESVAFVTTNYDLFLEQVLSVAAIGGRIDNMEWYTQSPKWLLAKLHGSVNWGRRILNHPSPSGGNIDLDMLSELELQLDPTIELLSSHQVRARGGTPIYPALVAPVEGKYGFVCPPEHVTALRELLPRCRHVLVVGHSGRDQDLLDLLRDELGECEMLAVVADSEAHVTETRTRLIDNVPQLESARFLSDVRGFSGFIWDNGTMEFCRGG